MGKAAWTRAFPKQARKLARHATRSKKRRAVIRAKRQRKRLNPISKQRRDNLKHYANIKREWKNDPLNQRCVITGEPTVEIHHTWGRIGDLLCMSRLWVAVSRKVHDWINSHPRTAASVGLLCPAGRYNEIPLEWEVKAHEYRLGIFRAYVHGIQHEDDALVLHRPQGLATKICEEIEVEVAEACKERFWKRLQ